MLHLSPKTGLWVTCIPSKRSKISLDNPCHLPYHAPVEEGEVAESLLWELYAPDELYREPSEAWANGLQRWKNSDGIVQRDYDLPAVVSEQTIVFYRNGHVHRTGDQPAVLDKISGLKQYYVKGVHHRNGDNPSAVGKDRLIYYKRGKLHRDDDKPAVIKPESIEFWKNGKLHRLDGPAAIQSDGTISFYDKGKHVKTQTMSPEGKTLFEFLYNEFFQPELY